MKPSRDRDKPPRRVRFKYCCAWSRTFRTLQMDCQVPAKLEATLPGDAQKCVICGEDIVADATQRSLNGIADCRALHRAPAGSWRPDVARANPALHHSRVQRGSAAAPAGPGNQQEFVAVIRPPRIRCALVSAGCSIRSRVCYGPGGCPAPLHRLRSCIDPVWSCHTTGRPCSDTPLRPC
jgi:hypothetical protein